MLWKFIVFFSLIYKEATARVAIYKAAERVLLQI